MQDLIFCSTQDRKPLKKTNTMLHGPNKSVEPLDWARYYEIHKHKQVVLTERLEFVNCHASPTLEALKGPKSQNNYILLVMKVPIGTGKGENRHSFPSVLWITNFLPCFLFHFFRLQSGANGCTTSTKNISPLPCAGSRAGLCVEGERGNLEEEEEEEATGA